MRDINHQELVEKLAVKLKDTAIPPTWAEYAKTGHGKQRPPVRKDWWQIRAAAVLLSIEKLGPVGVSKLSVKYGTRKDRGYKPSIFVPGSRNVLRKVLQQLESSKLVVQKEVDGHKGRIITKAGTKILSKLIPLARIATISLSLDSLLIAKRVPIKTPTGIVKAKV